MKKVSMSPAYASKLIKQKNAEIKDILIHERETSTTRAFAEEDVTQLRKAYSFAFTQEQLERLRRDIMTLKHAINQFNVTAVLPDLGYTIDTALVRMKMLSDQKERLSVMMRVQPVARQSLAFGNGKPEFVYRNYDDREVRNAYEKVDAELTQIQLALDKQNLDSIIEVVLSEDVVAIKTDDSEN